MQQNFREQVVFQQINTMRQLTNRLKQSEQRNAQLLEQLNQAENFATQELGRLDQMLTQLEGQINQVNQNVAQNFQQQQNYGQPHYGNPGTYGGSSYNPGYTPTQYGSSYNQYGQGQANQNRQ